MAAVAEEGRDGADPVGGRVDLGEEEAEDPLEEAAEGLFREGFGLRVDVGFGAEPDAPELAKELDDAQGGGGGEAGHGFIGLTGPNRRRV